MLKVRHIICWIWGHQLVPPHARMPSDRTRIIGQRVRERRYEPSKHLPTRYCRRCLLELDWGTP